MGNPAGNTRCAEEAHSTGLAAMLLLEMDEDITMAINHLETTKFALVDDLADVKVVTRPVCKNDKKLIKVRLVQFKAISALKKHDIIKYNSLIEEVKKVQTEYTTAMMKKMG